MVTIVGQRSQKNASVLYTMGNHYFFTLYTVRKKYFSHPFPFSGDPSFIGVQLHAQYLQYIRSMNRA